MRVKIENYNGYEVLELNFPNTRLEGTCAIESHAEEHFFNIAEVDEDETIKIRYSVIKNTLFEVNLKNLIATLVNNYL